MEGLLFFIILNVYYLVIIAAIIIAIIIVIKKKRKKKAMKNKTGASVSNVKDATMDAPVQNVQNTNTITENTSEADKASQGNEKGDWK